MGYNHLEIEKKWQDKWDLEKTYKCDTSDFSRPKYYVLDMFPYPSAHGLHVGHPEGYTATDIVCRMKRMQGFNVLHPMGFDSFGLPAEQYAIKTGNHPDKFTRENIDNFRRQIKALGFSYDWDREIATSDPSYYKWTQWIFIKLFEKGLAYIDERPVNYCPELGTVLANEEVIDGKSERGGFPVIRKMMKQWVLKITDYADKLLEELDNLDWPKSTLEMQRNWIGRSEGTNVIFDVLNSNYSFEVFTTRVDTLFGCTYCVLAPEHPLVSKITSAEQKDSVLNYINQCQTKSDLERTELNKEKTGVFIGAYAINPINNKKIPIYIGDYVLASYGTGAVMAVPAHDERDYAFAKKHNIDFIAVLDGDIETSAFVEDGKHINSSFADGLYIEDAKKVITEKLVEINKGYKKVSYKLRDWLFSRQRYWGEPIPIIHMEDGSLRAVANEELPLVLPEMDDYAPSGDGLSPLSKLDSWVNITIDGKKGQRETNTMPQWAGSCWYYARYIDPKNNKEIGNSQLLDHWLPVDLYIGGAEHAVLHLLYARFWHRFLYDQGVFSCKEPFKKLFHQGMILGDNNEKMSKSRGNVVNPDDVVNEFGADTLRLYEMFMGPLEASLPWSTSGLSGARKFIDRVYRLISEDQYKQLYSEKNDGSLDYVYNYTVKKVTEDYENLQFNTAISQLMIFANEVYKAKSIYKPYIDGFVQILAPICPHICSEMYEMLGHKELLDFVAWPKYDESKIVLDIVTIAIMINGKLKGTINANRDEEDAEIIFNKALSLENFKSQIENKTIVKKVFVKNKILNIVCK